MEKSSSSVKLPNIEKKSSGGDDQPREKFHATNWKSLSKKEIQKLPPQQRSKYLAYEPAPKECNEAMSAARKRLKEMDKSKRKQQKPPPYEEVVEGERHTKIIGQLKAAEARNRIRLMRLRYQNNRSSEVNHLIGCQPTALKAVRLQSLVPPSPDKIYIRDLLVKNERYRVNSLLEDETGLETARLLT
ncbi:protein LKAAEAR1-like [Pocillopora damicornis]|uniref:protein LKAAEAR1-like n=1 Tax=Pocillopora damicornis TaxID=46731 RepID=UPI000F558DF2|nr:protein LKAAEAR1-like [Pocillopora damicornis]